MDFLWKENRTIKSSINANLSPSIRHFAIKSISILDFRFVLSLPASKDKFIKKSKFVNMALYLQLINMINYK